jgi:hypothetical protein
MATSGAFAGTSRSSSSASPPAWPTTSKPASTGSRDSPSRRRIQSSAIFALCDSLIRPRLEAKLRPRRAAGIAEPVRPLPRSRPQAYPGRRAVGRGGSRRSAIGRPGGRWTIRDQPGHLVRGLVTHPARASRLPHRRPMRTHRRASHCEPSANRSGRQRLIGSRMVPKVAMPGNTASPRSKPDTCHAALPGAPAPLAAPRTSPTRLRR